MFKLFHIKGAGVGHRAVTEDLSKNVVTTCR